MLEHTVSKKPARRNCTEHKQHITVLPSSFISIAVFCYALTNPIVSVLLSKDLRKYVFKDLNDLERRISGWCFIHCATNSTLLVKLEELNLSQNGTHENKSFLKGTGKSNEKMTKKNHD